MCTAKSSMKYWRNHLSFVLSVVSLAGASAAFASEKEVLEPAFSLVRRAVDQSEVPGAIALVARHGVILRHEAFGLQDIENHLPFTTNTLCWIASITKPVTVAAAMTLVDRSEER